MCINEFNDYYGFLFVRLDRLINADSPLHWPPAQAGFGIYIERERATQIERKLVTGVQNDLSPTDFKNRQTHRTKIHQFFTSYLLPVHMLAEHTTFLQISHFSSFEIIGSRVVVMIEK